MHLFFLCLFWCGGIHFSRLLPLGSWNWILLGFMSITTILFMRKNPSARQVFLLLLLFEMGAAYQASITTNPDSSHIQVFNDIGFPASVTGEIITPPEILDRNVRFVLKAEQFCPGKTGSIETVNGKILVYTRALSDFQYGDTIQVYGLLETPPEYEGFSYREYLSREDIYAFLYSRESEIIKRSWSYPIRKALYQFRSHAHATLKSLYPDPEASLLSGILLGIEGGISTRMMEAFQQTGTAHIIAISGFNITLISAIFLNLMRSWLGRNAGIITAGAAICLYTILVGGDAAVVRAAIMVSISLIARLLGRQNHGYSALAAAVFVMTIFDTNILMDIGFQLSVLATLGLLFYGPLLENGFRRQAGHLLSEQGVNKITPWVNEFFLLTFAAQLTTMPLTISCFNQIPISSFLVNPIILPVQPPIMILGGISVLLGLIFKPAGQLAAWITWPFLNLTTRTVSFFASIDSMRIPLANNSFVIMLIYCALLAAGTFMVRTKAGKKLLQKTPALPLGTILAAVSICCILIWTAWMNQHDNRLRITLIPTGRSETVLIQSPAGRTVLLGCGDSPITLSEALGHRLSPLYSRIDWLLLGSSADQTTAGLHGIVDQYTINNILLSTTDTSPSFRSTAELISNSEISSQVMKAGKRLDFHDGVSLEILAAGEKGTAYLVTYGNFRLFFTHGEDTDMIFSLTSIPDIARVTAAILPASGGMAANPPLLIKHLDPSLVLLSVEPGSDETPHPGVLDQLDKRTLLRTDQNGWVTLSTDGTMLWIETELLPE